VFWGKLVFDQVDLGVMPRYVDVPSYAVMIKFIGHYETHVDMFFHYVTPLDFVLIR
jgi:hypothetical protein